MFVNGLGAVATGITTLVVLVAKFVEGAWITALLIVVMILLMRAVKRHYVYVAREIDLDRPIVPAEITEPIVVLPIDRWSRISEKALSFALSMSSDIRCVHVTDQPKRPTPSAINGKKTSPRRCARPASAFPSWLRFARRIATSCTQWSITCSQRSARPATKKSACWCPSWWCAHWWENLLHNRRSDVLKVILLMRGNRRIVVINIPWYLERG